MATFIHSLPKSMLMTDTQSAHFMDANIMHERTETNPHLGVIVTSGLSPANRKWSMFHISSYLYNKNYMSRHLGIMC